jgi:short-subunit dehydrogenase
LELKQFNINVVVLEPGIIATEFGDVIYGPTLKYSGKTAYSKLAVAMAKSIKESYEKPGASSPASVIANTVSKIVNSHKPKTRYRVGKFAKLLVWIRVFMGDTIFDKVVMSMVK